MALKLEAGKYYMDNTGDVHGPMAERQDIKYPFVAQNTRMVYGAHGEWIASNRPVYKRNLTHEVTITKVEPKIQIEEGKWYELKSGEIGQARRGSTLSDFPWIIDDNTYTNDGRYYLHGSASIHDVVREVEPPAPQYRPYTFEEAAEYLLGKTTKSSSGKIAIVTGIRPNTWKTCGDIFLSEHTFYPSGEPCGMKVS